VSKAVTAEEGENGSVIYRLEDGNRLIRYRPQSNPSEPASSRSWRNNNPGNLKPTRHSKQHGSIGVAGGFSIFPDYETGRKAHFWLLKTYVYMNLTLYDLPRRYTGVKPGEPDTDEAIRYRQAIQRSTQFDLQRKISSLSLYEFEILLDAMKKHEGWIPGVEEFIEVKNIICVHLNNKRVIAEFLIGDDLSSTWFARSEAIMLAEQSKLHAIVVHAKQGTYLRPEYHQLSFKKMVCKTA
jgi:hypothetical protein